MAKTPKDFSFQINFQEIFKGTAFGKVEQGGVVKMDDDYWDIVETRQGGRMIDMTRHTETVNVVVILRRELEHQEAANAAGKDRDEEVAPAPHD